MRRHKDDKRTVYQALTMVTQFSLNMLVPIAMMTVLGIWLDRKLGTSFWTIILFMVGAVAGGQNIYRMAKAISARNEEEERRISDGYRRKSENEK